MSANKISDLLPIHEGVKKPHAYQVFGLEGGEQDRELIKAAVQSITQKLADAKESTDPKLWRTAAKTVDKAKSILSDPKKRASLDARFGVINFGDEEATQAADPLAAMLPNADPLAASLPSSDPLAAMIPSGNPMSAPAHPGNAPVGTAPIAAPSAQSPPTAQPPAPARKPAPAPSKLKSSSPVRVRKKKTYRRNHSTAKAMLVLFGVAMVVVVGALGYFLFFSDGHLSIVSEDGKLSINTERDKNKAAPKRTNPRRVSRPKKNKGDGILNAPATSGISESIGNVASPKMEPEFPFRNQPMDSVPEMTKPEMQPTDTGTTPAEMATPETTPPEMATPEMAETIPSPTDASPNQEPEKTFAVEPAMEEKMELTPEMIAKADAQIATVEKLIKASDWKQMKPAAEKLSAMPLSDEQEPYATALYNLADLATFFRGGIVRGIASRNAAETFEVTEGVVVAVVETKPDGIILRVNGRNKVYNIAEMPFRLADRLADFALSLNKPNDIAAQYCYRVVAEKSSPEYREEALEWLDGLDGNVENVDMKQLAEAIKKIYK